MQSVRKLKGIQDAIWFTTKNPKQSYAQSCRGKVADSDQICVNKWLIVGDDKLGIRLTNLGSLPDILGAEPVERLWWGSFWLAGWWRLPLHFQSARRPGKHKEPSGDSTQQISSFREGLQTVWVWAAKTWLTFTIKFDQLFVWTWGDCD